MEDWSINGLGAREGGGPVGEQSTTQKTKRRQFNLFLSGQLDVRIEIELGGNLTSTKSTTCT
jgi:hypothetical protein